jgi:flagellar L-ring protein precursor FlgH
MSNVEHARRALLLACLLVSAAALAQDGRGEGSLIDPDRYQPLAADVRAHREGDTLTVLVLESTRASSRAGTEAAGEVGVDIRLADPANTWSAGANIGGRNRGAGGTSREGEVRAQLTVRVVGIDGPLLRVSGEQQLLVNGESQRIRLTGLVRPQDIAADNTVVSSRIADASIEFTGEGVVSEASRRSLLYRLFNWLRLI